jgi:hypothetical protein
MPRVPAPLARPRVPPRALPLGVAAWAVVGLVLVLWATRRGPGITPDSGYFIAAARSLAAGKGVLTPSGAPLTHFPPGYPALLAASSLARLDPYAAARWTDALTFAGLVLLVGALALRATRSVGVALAAAGLVVATPDLLALGAMVWSETLAIGLGLAGIGLLVEVIAPHPDEQVSDWTLWVSGLCVAGSILTRYASGAFWAAGLVACLGRPSPRNRRVREAVLWSATVWIPVLAWIARNRIIGDSVVNRVLDWHPPSAAQLRSGLTTLGGWIVVSPHLTPVATVAGGVVLAGLVAAAWWGWRARRAWVFVLALLAIVYLACVMVASTIADAVIPYDARILAPVGVMMAVLGPVVAAPNLLRKRWVMALVVFGLAIKLRYAVLWADQSGGLGLGYNNWRWRQSRTLAHLPPDGPLYANWVMVPYLLAGRAATELPRVYRSTSRRPNPEYRGEVERLARGGGWVVYFDTWPTPPFIPTVDALGRDVRPVLVDSSADGRIYRIAEPAATDGPQDRPSRVRHGQASCVGCTPGHNRSGS